MLHRHFTFRLMQEVYLDRVLPQPNPPHLVQPSWVTDWPSTQACYIFQKHCALLLINPMTWLVLYCIKVSWILKVRWFTFTFNSQWLHIHYASITWSHLYTFKSSFLKDISRFLIHATFKIGFGTNDESQLVHNVLLEGSYFLTWKKMWFCTCFWSWVSLEESRSPIAVSNWLWMDFVKLGSRRVDKLILLGVSLAYAFFEFLRFVSTISCKLASARIVCSSTEIKREMKNQFLAFNFIYNIYLGRWGYASYTSLPTRVWPASSLYSEQYLCLWLLWLLCLLT